MTRRSSKEDVVHLCLFDLATCSDRFVGAIGDTVWGASFLRIMAKPRAAMPNNMRIERIPTKMQQPASHFLPRLRVAAELFEC